ncbi:MAG: 50S ribosomal protein L1 [Bradymonadales bacterium]|jgi:large subunit ribosomal protein L1
MPKRGKRYKDLLAKVDRQKRYDNLQEVMELVKEISTTKFDASVDVAFRLGVDPRHADQMVRGAVVLPNGIGKTVRVLVFAAGEKEKEALDAGADFVGADDLVEKIQGGWVDFDKAIATPDMMGKVGKLGRVLGPRGLMPNPKIGTVTTDIAKAVSEAKAGRIEFRVERAGIVHAPIGRVSFSAEKLVENFKALSELIVRLKPATSKGQYIKSVTVSSTMSPGIKVDPLSI